MSLHPVTIFVMLITILVCLTKSPPQGERTGYWIGIGALLLIILGTLIVLPQE